MEALKLVRETCWINTVDGECVEVPYELLVHAVLMYKERFNGSQLRRVRTAIDRETLHRSKLIQSQTKAT